MTEVRRTRLLVPALRAGLRRPIFLMVVVSRYRVLHRAGVGRNLADQSLYDSSLAATPGLAVQSPQPTLLLAELRSEEHTSELQSRQYLVCRLLLEKKKKI